MELPTRRSLWEASGDIVGVGVPTKGGPDERIALGKRDKIAGTVATGKREY
jgi:hypothetical protein